MLNTKQITPEQLNLVLDIVKATKGRTVFTRSEIKALHNELRGHTASPYFIAKNLAAKFKKGVGRGRRTVRGLYDVSVFLRYAAANVEQAPKEFIRFMNSKKGAALLAQ